MTGLVILNRGSLYRVKAQEGKLYDCKLKGSFKINEIETTNPVAVGDIVDFDYPDSLATEPIGWITNIHPRTNYIIRRASKLSKQAHIIGANLSRALLIVTINYPVTSTTFIDRFLATAEAYRVEAALVFNKADRYDNHEQRVLNEWIDLYEGLGYRCFTVSAMQQQGLEPLKEYISAGITLLSGHSGVGKSTFINALVPEAHLRTQEISVSQNVGVHTTSYSEMIPFGDNPDTYLIDTPGVKGFGTIDFETGEVGHYFREIFDLSKECYFNNCTHTHEPKCAVCAGVKRGAIAQSRYKSYLSILKDDDYSKYRL